MPEVEGLDAVEEEVVVAVPLLVEADVEEPDAALEAVEVGAKVLTFVFPAVGVETPILPASAAAVRANTARKSTVAATGFEAVAVAAADNPAWEEDELIEVR